jgi:membrane-bound ClpP family serine protease
MGANSKQGWFLFLFLIGFTFLIAGLAYLGPLFTIFGILGLIGSLIGFYQIKPLEHGAEPEMSVVTGNAETQGHTVRGGSAR